MAQQNQFIQINIGSVISAPTDQYPQRQFKLLQLLGQGSEGVVYKAIPQNWGFCQNEIAIKFSINTKDSAREFYKLIIEYQNKYENPNQHNNYSSNIIRIYDCFDISIYFVIVMELGQVDLYKYIEQNKQVLTLQQKQQLCYQILTSISFLHSQNVIHRDIKTENYMMVDNQAKLIDFGLTKVLQGKDQRFMTTLIGTKLFQSPELIEGKSDYTMAVDVWALAFVFYEIIKGVPLLDCKTYQELDEQVRAHIQNQSFINNKIDQLLISDEWKQIIKRMLHPDPNQRIKVNEAQEKLQKSNISKLNTAPTPIFPQQQIMNLLNQTIMALQQPNNINILQQTKEQSIRQLCTLKDLIIKTQNQLDNNPIFVLSTDPGPQIQSIQKKEIPHNIKQKLDEQRKRIQEIEEKSISGQEASDLNQNFQLITNELEYLKKITEEQQKKYNDYKSIQQQYDNLKELQKNILKQEMLQKNIQELQSQYKGYNLLSIQKDIENNQKKINQLELDMNTLKFMENQKQKQLQVIDNLTKQIEQLQNLDEDVLKQKDEILELIIKQKYLESNKNELENNKTKIQEYKQEIVRLQSFIPEFDQQKKEIEDLDKQLKELENIEKNVKKLKEDIITNKAKLKELSNEQVKLYQYTKDLEKLKQELKDFEQVQSQVESLSKEIKELTIERNIKLLKDEESKQLNWEKKQLLDQQDQRKIQTTRQGTTYSKYNS